MFLSAYEATGLQKNVGKLNVMLMVLFNFIKKETLARAFSCEYCEIVKNTFFTEHPRMTASDDLKILYSLERDSLVKLSKFDVAISPKPTGRQRISIYLRAFCDETIVALETRTGVDKDSGDSKFSQTDS